MLLIKLFSNQNTLSQIRRLSVAERSLSITQINFVVTSLILELTWVKDTSGN